MALHLQVLFKPLQNPSKRMTTWKRIVKYNISTNKLKVRHDLWDRGKVLSSDTSFRYAKDLCHVISKSFYASGNHSPDRKAYK